MIVWPQILLPCDLTNAGYNVIVAVDGEEAIKKGKGIPSVSDYSRYYAAKERRVGRHFRIKKNSQDTADIPVIIVSIVDNKDLGFSLEAAEYLIKPIDRIKLINTVNACIPPKRIKANL